jgi:rhodanese-related sulfurtransferase
LSAKDRQCQIFLHVESELRFISISNRIFPAVNFNTPFNMKKKCIWLFIGMFLTIAVFAQSKSYNVMLKTLLSHTVPEFDVTQAKSAAANQAYFLDARERKEYEVSHIKNARFVGYDGFSLENVADIPKNSPVVVYCSVGYRSEKIAEKLIAVGFTNVANLYGGVFQWVNEGNEVVDTAGQPTPNVHAYNRMWGIWLKKGKKVYK